jgi:hypothetical protein
MRLNAGFNEDTSRTIGADLAELAASSPNAVKRKFDKPAAAVVKVVSALHVTPSLLTE